MLDLPGQDMRYETSVMSRCLAVSMTPLLVLLVGVVRAGHEDTLSQLKVAYSNVRVLDQAIQANHY